MYNIAILLYLTASATYFPLDQLCYIHLLTYQLSSLLLTGVSVSHLVIAMCIS
jgi:hypothetical protein